MPRCGTDQIVVPPVNTGPGSGGNTLFIETPDGELKVTGARVVKISRGEWHPIQIQSGEVWMEINTSLYYPAMDLVMCWEPGGQVSWSDSSNTNPPPTYVGFLPSGVTLDTAALNGLRLQLGLGSTGLGVYTSIKNASTTVSTTPTWTAYSCFIGDRKSTTGSDNGDPMTEYVMRRSDGSLIKGGWVFAAPNGADTDSGPHWITLSATRFAIIGAPYGGLFGSGREFYYECGLEADATLLAQIRSEFGFASNAGSCAYIKVYDDVNDFLINVEPE